MNRRAFFKITAGALISAVAAKSLVATPSVIYKIHGDGVGDDTMGMQALINGHVVEISDTICTKGVGWDGNVLNLPAGTFRIDGTVKVGGINDAILNFGGGVWECAGLGLSVEDCNGVMINNLTLTPQYEQSAVGFPLTVGAYYYD